MEKTRRDPYHSPTSAPPPRACGRSPGQAAPAWCNWSPHNLSSTSSSSQWGNRARAAAPGQQRAAGAAGARAAAPHRRQLAGGGREQEPHRIGSVGSGSTEVGRDGWEVRVEEREKRWWALRMGERGARARVDREESNLRSRLNSTLCTGGVKIYGRPVESQPPVDFRQLPSLPHARPHSPGRTHTGQWPRALLAQVCRSKKRQYMNKTFNRKIWQKFPEKIFGKNF
jgi:hypothetical protein